MEKSDTHLSLGCTLREQCICFEDFTWETRKMGMSPKKKEGEGALYLGYARFGETCIWVSHASRSFPPLDMCFPEAFESCISLSRVKFERRQPDDTDPAFQVKADIRKKITTFFVAGLPFLSFSSPFAQKFWNFCVDLLETRALNQNSSICVIASRPRPFQNLTALQGNTQLDHTL